MALLSAVTASLQGTTVTYAAAGAGGDTFAYGRNTEFRVKNGSGGSITVTLVVPGNTQFGQAQPDLPITIGAGVEKSIGLARGLVDGATGTISVTYSAVTSVTVALVTVP